MDWFRREVLPFLLVGVLVGVLGVMVWGFSRTIRQSPPFEYDEVVEVMTPQVCPGVAPMFRITGWLRGRPDAEITVSYSIQAAEDIPRDPENPDAGILYPAGSTAFRGGTYDERGHRILNRLTWPEPQILDDWLFDIPFQWPSPSFAILPPGHYTYTHWARLHDTSGDLFQALFEVIECD
jgi:hypothetical protein